MAKKTANLLRASACVVALLCSGGAQAGQFKVLHNFSGGFDGSFPAGDLFIDKLGTLYGTTTEGGIGGNNGTLFKIEPGKKEKVVHSFSGGAADGSDPYGGIIADRSGSLYGTTMGGGQNGLGVVYDIAPDGSESLVHTFQGICCGIDGSFGVGNLTTDKLGNMYGGTQNGGSSADLGSVFKIDASGGESVVHGFAGSSDGATPRSGPTIDKAGSLYGTTVAGGASSCGVVYRIKPTGSESVVHTFADSPDGCRPAGSVVLDKKGNIYGTTLAGGGAGVGTVYIVAASGVETVLHTFCGQADCLDGNEPVSKLIADEKGTLYGTTYYGGANNVGVVFELKRSGAFKVLHSFGGADGANPFGGLVADADGNLFGTTVEGGANSLGVVFEIAAKK